MSMTEEIKTFRNECQRHGIYILSDEITCNNNYIEYKDAEWRLGYSLSTKLLLIVNYPKLDITVWDKDERVLIFWLNENDTNALEILRALEREVLKRYFQVQL